MASVSDLKYCTDAEYVKLKFVDKSVSTVKRSNIVGFCSFPEHRGWLTKGMANRHKCYEKRCTLLHKEDCNYWRVCEAIEKEAEQRKQLKREAKAKADEAQALILEMEETAQNLADSFEYDIIITRVALSRLKPIYIINYVSDALYNDYYDYRSIIETMQYLYSAKFILKKVKGLDGEYIDIDSWTGQTKGNRSSLIRHADSEIIDIEAYIKEREVN